MKRHLRLVADDPKHGIAAGVVNSLAAAGN
jgi:hypothetical protein